LSGHRAIRRGLAALALCLFRLARAAGGEERTVELPELVVPLPRGQAEADPTASATVVDAARFEGEAKSVGELVATSPGWRSATTEASGASPPLPSAEHPPTL